jgi:polyferredoxin
VSESGNRDLPGSANHTLRCTGNGNQPRSSRGPWRAAVLLAVHAFIAWRIAIGLEGEPTLSPLEPSEAAAALASRVVDAGLIFFALTVLTTLVVGRFFCGWACHLVALQDGAAWLLGKLGLRPRPIRSRLLACAPFVAAAVMFGWPFVESALSSGPQPPWRLELTTDDYWGRFPGPVVAGVTFLVCGFAAVWILGAKGFCTYACPYGALFGMADRFAPGRIRVDRDACETCGHCTAVCTSNVVVHDEVARFGQVVDPGCMKCLDCVSACPKDALSFGFGALAPTDRSRNRIERPRARTYDFSRGEELAMAGVFVLALASLFKSYALVPLLLATTLAVLVAFASVLAVRLVRRGDLRFQGWTLKRSGSWTPAGATALAVCLAAVGLTGHTGAVQTSEVRAFLALRQVSEQRSPSRTESLERAHAALLDVERLGLIRREGLYNQLGQVEAELGLDEAATFNLEQAILEAPDALAPRRKLVEVLDRSDRPEALAEALWGLIEREPLDRDRAIALATSGTLTRLVQAQPEALAPRLIVIAANLAVGDVDTAELNLDRATERFGAEEPSLLELRARVSTLRGL